MKKYFAFIVLIYISYTKTNAQSDYRDGYIITNNNDTIFGLVNVKGNRTSALKCHFKKDLKSNDQTFTPKELIAYRYSNGKYYTSESVLTKNGEKQLFLEYLVNGVVNIYYYCDNEGEHYLIKLEDNMLHELKNSTEEITVNNNHYFKEKKEYKGLLKIAFKDYTQLFSKIDRMPLTRKALIKIDHEYHKYICSEAECITYEKKILKPDKTFGIIVGLNSQNIIQIKDYPDIFFYYDQATFDINLYPSIGIYYKINLPTGKKRLFLQYEGTFSRSEMKMSNTYIEPIYDQPYYTNITLNQNSFNNLCQLKYESPKGKIRPTLQIGGFIKFLFSGNCKNDLQILYSWGDEYYSNQSDDNPFHKKEYGFNCGIGLKSTYLKGKEINCDVRYQKGFGLLNNLRTNTFSINLGFQIAKL